MPIPRSATTLILALLLLTGSQPVLAQQAKLLEGSVKEEQKGGVLLDGSANKSQNGKVLEGSIKDEATLRPSLKVIPSIPGITQPGSRYTGGITQFKGSKQYSPAGHPVVQARPGLAPGNQQFGVIPPISSYTLSPGTGILSAPGFEVTRPSSPKGISTYTPAQGFTSLTSIPGMTSLHPEGVSGKKSYKGITSFAPGYEVSTEIKMSGQLLLGDWGKSLQASFTSISGVRTYAPGYEVLHNPPPAAFLSSLPQSRSSPAARHGITSWIPGFEISVCTPRKGISTYVPGYEVAVSTARYTKNTLGGMWWASPGTTPELAANPGVLPEGTFVQPVLPEGEAPLIATAGSLEHNPAVEGTNLTWNAWYRQVAKAIYSRWQYAEVGPGVATVQVTVTRDRNMYCQIVDFAPALYVERDIPAETAFREAAVRAVNNVQSYEIPRFPGDSKVQDITFDVLLKRTVDGPAGFDLSLKAKNEAP